MLETGFSLFWDKFPRHIAKKAAQKAYDRAVKQYGHEAVMACLEIMLATEWKGRKLSYIPHAATYLNREEFEDPRCEMLEDDLPEDSHRCTTCRPSHVWKHDGPCDPWCWGQREKQCPEETLKMRETIARGLEKVKR